MASVRLQPIRRILLWLTGVVALATTSLVLALQFWILPNINHWRADIAASISASSGERVTLGRIDAGWQGWHPSLRIQSLQIADAQQHPLLYLTDIEGEMSWSTLLFGELRLARLTLSNQAFSLRRDRNGTIWLAGLALNQPNGNHTFVQWLLHQRLIQLNHASLSWQDDQRPAPTLFIHEVNFSLTNFERWHNFHLSATPPTLIAHPIDIQGSLTGRSPADPASWSGKISLRLRRADLAQWQPWVTLPLGIRRGFGDVDASLQFARNQIIEASARGILQQLSLQAAPDLPRLDLIDLSGGVDWKRLGSAQSLQLDHISLRTADLVYLAPLDFYLRIAPATAHQAPQGELRADNADLATLNRLGHYLPLDTGQRNWLAQHAPSGWVQSLRADWSGALPRPQKFHLHARFRTLGIASAGGQPGVSGLSGQIDGDETSGSLTLASQQTNVDLPDILFEPHVALDTLTGQLRWKKLSSGYQLQLSQINLANADFDGNLFGEYTWLPGKRGLINLSGGLLRGRGIAVCHYLPLAVKQPAYDWVCTNLLGGDAKDVQFHVEGDLDHYPFHNDGQGLLEVRIPVNNASIRPNPDFPAIDHIRGIVEFAGTKMLIHSDSARLYNAQIRNASAEIPDLFGGLSERLLVSGQANGTASDFIRFTNESPIGSTVLDHLTDGASGSGKLQLALHLQLPFHDMNHPTVSGRLEFNRNDFILANGLPPMRAVQGKLDFTQTGISANNISLRLFGRQATMDSQTQNGITRLNVKGQLVAGDLVQWLPAGIAAHFTGTTPWQARIDMVRGRIATTTFDSTLTGLDIALPAPLDKTASAHVPLHVTSRRTGDDRQLIDVGYGAVFSAQLLTAAASGPGLPPIERGNIHFGGPAQLPSGNRITITGKVARADLDGWLAAGTSGQAGLPLDDIRLDIGTASLFERNFDAITLHAHSSDNRWLTSLHGPTTQGELTWQPGSGKDSRGTLQARFTSLTIPSGTVNTARPSGDGAAHDAANDGANWPALDIDVDALQLGSRRMGRLEIRATPIAGGLHFDRIALIHPDSNLTMSADWTPHATPQTNASMRLVVNNLGDFLTRFDEADTIHRGKAVLDGHASWDGAPLDIPIASLNGAFRLQAENGQFLKIEPGAARLLGVLSLQDLPRHMTLDFRDVFSDGFAFDDISATLDLNHGIIHSNDFVMQGPAATVEMHGEVDLNAQTQRLYAVVSPKLSESVALASSLVGGPIVGLGVLAVQKLLENPVGHAIRFDYAISGTWSHPKIDRTGQENEKK